MPSLTNEHIEQFQALYLKRFGVMLTKEEALTKGVRLVSLFEVVLRQNVRNENNVRPSSTGMVINK